MRKHCKRMINNREIENKQCKGLTFSFITIYIKKLKKHLKIVITSNILIKVVGNMLPYPCLTIDVSLPFGITDIMRLTALHDSSSNVGSITKLSPIC